MRKYTEHNRLLRDVVRKLPQDYAPWGNVTEEQRDPYVDCSCGCKFYRVLEGPLGADWGVCTNPKSHRNGLLTFEHQGCMQFKASYR